MTILVTGATGTVGRLLVDELLSSGQKVRALTRDPSRARMPEGVEVVAGDLTEGAAGLGAALDGVSRLHLLTTAGDGYEPLAKPEEIVSAAVAAGVRRITVLGSPVGQPVEAAVQAAGVEWTIVQPVEFMANALGWVEAVKSEGVVREPFGSTRSALVHEADIAAVLATALVEDGHSGKVYPVTGPEALTIPEKVATIAEATGLDIRYVELSEAEARANWEAAGYYSPEDIEFFVEMGANPPEVGYTVVPTVQEVTGRPARTFAQWAKENADAFR
ncbi:NAD(P)H-binding protein [Streptomyces durbertensis]|uniref:NAD(P)H-binding protein n=1 Tax=Streptomyces durbertensis TaxID=2448886 RepID=A0ABR6EFM3_9ACTN|nr:NAD(P)H-binding protein [Streptomyces durbertensis]MBB1244129.1 NAD(P)H-binding protein [Streptomyces durbertensis]